MVRRRLETIKEYPHLVPIIFHSGTAEIPDIAMKNYAEEERTEKVKTPADMEVGRAGMKRITRETGANCKTWMNASQPAKGQYYRRC